MIAAVWTASLLLFIAAGLSVWKFADIAALDLPARISIAFTCGLTIVATLMYLESALGIRWSALTLGIPFLVIVALSAWRLPIGSRTGWPRGYSIAFAAVALISLYAAASARMTIADLMYFWGPKAVHFFHERAIDVEFLRFPHYYLMHPDYPPLVPLTWAASSMIAGKFSYWGAVLTAPLLLIAAALTFRGFASPVLGPRKSAAFATLLLAVTTVAAIAGSAAGGGDPYLLAFEATALSALTFSRARGATVIAAIALAGAAFAKVEGAAFAASVGIALLLVGRFRSAIAVVSPAVLLVASWIAFSRHHGLLDAYGRADRQLHLSNLGAVLRWSGQQLSYRSLYLPWIAALGPFVVARSFRPAILPLLVALASLAYSLYFYLHEPNPLWWIQSSAERVMTTTLLCFVVATAAASE
ncbi:MAG TPA: hypothetical protein VFM36_04220 [Thermoanaerobaculia bacterium]|nr:hypothetical protein [Thermoanaerobaculia bacterium]